MENYIVENVNNDFLSQSYSQSIERITGTKDHIFNYEIPKKLLKNREEAWVNLFGKYSKEMSDDIELNVDTLEPDEEETEIEVCEEEYSCEQRIPMRKPATLVQYWINTGNQPYKALLDENDVSETGTSLSEKEITLSSYSSVSNIINEGTNQEYKSESSCSSVNTAAYILSNANITNKADTIAIIESAKCGKNINSSKNICIKDIKVTSDNKIQCIENARINCVTHNDNRNVNTNVPDIELCSISKEYIASKTCDQPTTNIVTSSGDAIQPNMYSQRCEQTNKMTMLSTSQRSLDIQSRDNIAQQVDETSKQLTGDDENNGASNQDEMLEKDTPYEKGVSENIIAQEIITKNTNLTAFYRKKLYTGRSSPIDLIQTERHSISRLSGAKQSLHPALDSDCTIKRETLLVHKGKSQNVFPFGKTNLGSKKTKRKRRRKRSSMSDKNIIHYTDTSNELPNNNRIQNYIINSSSKISSDHNNSDKRDDIPFSERNNANIFVRNETCKLDLASLNINPIVLLERIEPSFKRHEFKSAENNHITRKSNVHNYRHLNKSNKYICEVENVELKTIDSDESTILVCQCKTNAQHSASFSKESDCSLNGIQQKEILNKFKTHSSNPDEINRTDNVKLREIKIALERLPSNICFNDTNIFADKNIISENTNLRNNKRERRIEKTSKISACENVEASIRTIGKVDNNYSFRMHTKSKKYNDPRIIDTSDIVAEHQVFDKIESEFPIQYKNDSKVSQSNRSKYSVLTFTSSDEDDDFVRLIQRPKKRSKFSINDKLLDETNAIEKNLCDETKFVATNKDKCHYSRNLGTVIFSSKKPKTTRETFESIKGRKESSEIEIKSFDKTTASSKMCKNGKFSFIPNENDNDSVAKNLDKRKKRASFLNKSINNSNERPSNTIVKRNGIDYKDDTCSIFFQTKTFYSDSSDSEENNSYTAPTRKAFKNSFVHHKSQYHNHANLEEFCNDSIAKRYNRKHSSSLNSSFEKHDVANQIHDIKIGLESTSKEAKISKQLDNEEFHDNINSRINNTRKDMSPCFINDTSIRDITTQKVMFSSISIGKHNFSSLSKNKQISDKPKNSTATQQDDVKSPKLLMFQTKTYYDSDSNESL